MSLRPAALVALLLACSSSSAPTASPAPAPTPSSGGATGVDAAVSALSNDPDAASLAAPDAAPEAPAQPVAIVVGERREVPSPSPRVRITAPANNATVRDDRVEVRLDVQGWRNVADANDLRHVHVVLDNNPYIRVDDPSRPVVLEHLSAGTHVVRAFPGWETHETIKTPGAYAVAVFHVGAATRGFGYDPRGPMLTYSRPKGRVEGAGADRILLDFYLANVPAAQMGPTGFRVRPSIDGRAMDPLTAWVPHYIEHLPDGEHTIGLELLGPDGNVAPGPFNRAEQRITVSRTPSPPAPAAAPASPHAGH